MIITKAHMVNVTKEANSRHILGPFLIYLSKFANEQKILTGTLNIDFEFVVWDDKQAKRNPSADAAVVVMYDQGSAVLLLVMTCLFFSRNTTEDRLYSMNINHTYHYALNCIQNISFTNNEIDHYM